MTMLITTHRYHLVNTCERSDPLKDYTTLIDLLAERDRLQEKNARLFAIIGPYCSEGIFIWRNVRF